MINASMIYRGMLLKHYPILSDVRLIAQMGIKITQTGVGIVLSDQSLQPIQNNTKFNAGLHT